MWSRMTPIPATPALMGPALAASILIALAVPASARDLRHVESYGHSAAGYAGDYGYAGDFVRGAYVGAPLTRVPRPSEIVPRAWSYGTYGIPTVSGIPPAPVGHPTLTVIESGGPTAASRRGGAEAGVRVIEVRVPRR